MAARGLLVDIQFAATGIEREIVEAARPQHMMAGLQVPVARLGHLIAMKVLAEGEHRLKDVADLQALIPGAPEDELTLAREAVRLIAEHGFARHKDLVANLEAFIERFRR